MKKSNNTKEYDAVVVGAGVIGASLALALSQKTGWRIALIEKSEQIIDATNHFENNQRVTALGMAAKNVLDELTVWSHLNVEQAYPFQRMYVWDEGTDGELEFLAHEYAAEALGYMVDHFGLQRLLQTAVRNDENIDDYFSTSIRAMETRNENQGNDKLSNPQRFSTEIFLHEGLSINANWVFAVDGVNSQLRQQAGIQVSQYSYQQKGIVAKIQTQYSHESTAWQRFLSSGPIALLPLSNGQCSIVWTLGNKDCDELLALDDHAFSARLKSALQSRLGDIELCSKRHAFPLQSKHAESYLKENLILVGDAAHGIHPLAGQGANLGFGDIAALIEAIGDLDSTDVKMRRALRRFERQRKLENYSMDSLMTGLESIFSSENVAVTSLRRVGLKALNANILPKSLLADRVLNR